MKPLRLTDHVDYWTKCTFSIIYNGRALLPFYISIYNISLNATLQLDILALELKQMYQRLKTIT